nr:MAG TPA: baseplate wedge protein [Caudoviricetes sp.]
MLKSYTTQQGDMWDSIAYKCYGDEAGINALMTENEAYVDTVVFPTGIVLAVPEYKKPVTNTLPPWRR